MRAPQLVRVRWLDTMSDSAWGQAATIRPVGVLQVGYLAREEKDFIVLSSGYRLDEGEIRFFDATAIPRGCLLELTPVVARRVRGGV